MQFNLYFIAKLILLFYVWAGIAFCILLILKSRKIYLDLQKAESLFLNKKREVTRNVLPLVFNLANKNELFKLVLNLDKHNLKDFFLSVFPLFFQGLFFYQWIKTGFNLTRKVLR